MAQTTLPSGSRQIPSPQYTLPEFGHRYDDGDTVTYIYGGLSVVVTEDEMVEYESSSGESRQELDGHVFNMLSHSILSGIAERIIQQNNTPN